MSVVGIGTDIVEVERLRNMPEKTLARLAKRVFTERELKVFESHAQPVSFLAKRWAAKEAAAKALGTGIAAGVSFQHFDIQSKPSGQPILILTDVALQKAKALGASSWLVTISDEKHYACAFVVLS